MLAKLDESTPEAYGTGEEYWDGADLAPIVTTR